MHRLADDYIIFCRATKRAVRSIRYILNHYYKVSGQLVKYHKLNVQFSKRTNTTMAKKIADIL